MKLFLASDGSDPETIDKLEIFIGGLDGKSVVYIPTAKNGNVEENWEKSRTWTLLKKRDIDLTSVELEKYKSGVDINLFKGKDIIWVTGGACGYLMYWIYRSGFDLILPEILKNSLYVGSSAGSMITAPTLDLAEWYIGEVERGASYFPGLGLTDFDFYPHYEDKLYNKIKKNYHGKKMYLVKNGEEILVEDKKITVLGEERVITNG